MLIGTYQFRPTPYLTIIVLIFLLPLFVGLGIWQLSRAEQKQAQLETMKLRLGLTAYDLNQAPISVENARYRAITAAGTYLEDRRILIDNRKHQGRTGYHVITPLLIPETDRYLLVNQGWVADLSEIKSAASSPATVQTIGVITVPEPPALDLKFTPTAAEPWPYMTLEQYAAWSGLALYPFVLLLDPKSSDGYLRHWQLSPPNVSMHHGYALQWFAFALIALAIWLRLSLEKCSSGGDRNE